MRHIVRAYVVLTAWARGLWSDGRREFRSLSRDRCFESTPDH